MFFSPQLSVLPLISLALLHPQLSLCATKLHSRVEDHSWPLILSWQTWPSCLVICSEDLHSAYQSAPPADYLSKRAETKAANTETVGSGFSTGVRMAACSIKRKTKFQSGVHSIGYTVLIMQSITSQHDNPLLIESCVPIWCWGKWNLLLMQLVIFVTGHTMYVLFVWGDRQTK